MAKTYPYSFHIALDGNGINGLEGMAGVCAFLYDPADNSYAYKVQYYDGISAGHAVSVNPDRTYGFLGNAGQHLHLYDASSLCELDRMSSLRYEPNDTSIRGSTHVVWLNSAEFITSIGDYFYKFHINALDKGERIGQHKVKIPHAIKVSASGRYLCYGSMDHPGKGRRGEAKEVGVFDLKSGQATRIEMPATCWHVVCHPSKDLFYCVSFRVEPRNDVDYHEWAMSFLKEYAFEIDAESQTIVRHWACSRELPAHINSDMTLSDTELIFCNGASQTIVCIDLATFAKFRIIDERPTVTSQAANYRQVATQVYDVMARGGVLNNGRQLLNALRVSRFTLLDSIYACQISRDQSLLFTANRGLNHITVYNYPDATIRARMQLPDLHHFMPMKWFKDPRLGFHHSYLISPPSLSMGVTADQVAGSYMVNVPQAA